LPVLAPVFHSDYYILMLGADVKHIRVRV
jgi:hypothetical protein